MSAQDNDRDFQPVVDYASGSTHHDNTATAFIRITEDKLRNYIYEFKDLVALRSSWFGPFGAFVSFIGCLVTADFTDKFGQSKDFWKSSFMILGGLCLTGTIVLLFQIAWNWKKCGTEALINKIKNATKGG